MSDYIEIKGARVNNLKNVSVKIPRDKLVVIAGVSGSGKSSLAFDTLYAEGQRRYVESLSSYARQFMGRMTKPDCDFIRGLPPAIAVEQRTVTRNSRSTVGTSTEIYDYLRLLFARVGKTYSPISGEIVKKHTANDVIDTINDIRRKQQQLITVVGCGGDRDKTKRPEMAKIAATGSDKLVLTSDNPRSENPDSILDDMEAGLDAQQLCRTVRITDRRQAIRTACMMAKEGDIVLVAGKGHEKYQETNGVRSHFDDVEEVNKCLNMVKG